MKITVTEAVNILATEAMRLGSDASDSQEIVRALVTSYGLGFNAWFCVCCEIADRNAQAEGFSNQFERAATFMGHAKLQP